MDRNSVVFVMRELLNRIDAYGTTDTDFNEGHPEDRCPVCEHPVQDHYATDSRRRIPARWPHRRAALLAIIIERLS